MSHYKHHQRGLYLTETLLVLVIMSAIIFYGLREIYNLRVSVDALQVRDNVDLIFKAMGYYYKANCGSSQSAWGTLNPKSSPPNPFQINIQTDLRDRGYLTANIGVNTFVDYAAALGTVGYVAQFNNYSNDQRTVCVRNNASNVCDQWAPIARIYSWKAQVAVKVQDSARKESYLKLLRGDCLSSPNGNVIKPCSDNAPGDYIVWERNPSLASLYGNPTSWMTNPLLTRFANAYHTYDVTYLIESGGQTPTSQQYLVCGD